MSLVTSKVVLFVTEIFADGPMPSVAMHSIESCYEAMMIAVFSCILPTAIVCRYREMELRQMQVKSA